MPIPVAWLQEHLCLTYLWATGDLTGCTGSSVVFLTHDRMRPKMERDTKLTNVQTFVDFQDINDVDVW